VRAAAFQQIVKVLQTPVVGIVDNGSVPARNGDCAPDAQDRRALIDRHLGDVVRRVERLRFSDGEEGELQLRFATSVLRFRGAGDGERLEVSDEPWRDPFAPPLSPENEEFVKTHGVWRLVDVSVEPGYREWVGTRLAKVVLAATKATLTSDAGEVMTIAVEFDELVVSHIAALP
jgi:hypothetical protein